MARDYPVCLRLEGRSCVVVGGGAVGEERARGLAEAGARVTVVAEVPSPALVELAGEGTITLAGRPFRPGDLEGAFLVVAATDDAVANRAVREEAARRGVLLNAASEAGHSDVTIPAVLRRGDLQIAISTGGKSPSLAAFLRGELAGWIGPEMGALAEMLGRMRRGPGGPPGDAASRRRAWRRALSPELFRRIRRGDLEGAEDLLRRSLSGPAAGLVSLVGAGPGDPGLLTLAGRDRLSRADCVFYDRLADPSLLDLAPRDAELTYVGKAYGRHTLEQEELNRILIERARQGKRVVRLKGGDPFVFGRGAEEALALAGAGIAFEIVPGVSSAVAVPAYAGIPLTDRNKAHSAVIVSGHKHPDDPASQVDWPGLGASADTIVVLMGLRHLEGIAAALIGSGRSSSTPVALIEWGTHPHQRVVVSDLSGAAAAAEAAAISSPAVVVVGEVVRLRTALSWFERAGSG